MPFTAEQLRNIADTANAAANNYVERIMRRLQIAAAAGDYTLTIGTLEDTVKNTVYTSLRETYYLAIVENENNTTTISWEEGS